MSQIPTAPVATELQYCPVCKKIVQPNQATAPGAKLKDGRVAHAACLRAAAKAPDAWTNAAANRRATPAAAATPVTAPAANKSKAAGSSARSAALESAAPAARSPKRNTTSAVTTFGKPAVSTPPAHASADSAPDQPALATSLPRKRLVFSLAAIAAVLLLTFAGWAIFSDPAPAPAAGTELADKNSAHAVPPAQPGSKTASAAISNTPANSAHTATAASATGTAVTAPADTSNPSNAATHDTTPAATLHPASTEPPAAPPAAKPAADDPLSPTPPPANGFGSATPAAGATPASPASVTPAPGAPAQAPAPAPAGPAAPAAPAGPAGPAGPGTVLLNLDGKDLKNGSGHWKRMTGAVEEGQAFLQWTAVKLNQFPFFEFNVLAPMPKDIHLRVVYRVKNFPGKALAVRVFFTPPAAPAAPANPAAPAAPQPESAQATLPAGAEGVWLENDAVIHGVAGPVNQLDVRWVDGGKEGTVIEIKSIIVSDGPLPPGAAPAPAPQAAQTQQAQPATPAAPAAPALPAPKPAKPAKTPKPAAKPAAPSGPGPAGFHLQ